MKKTKLFFAVLIVAALCSCDAKEPEVSLSLPATSTEIAEPQMSESKETEQTVIETAAIAVYPVNIPDEEERQSIVDDTVFNYEASMAALEKNAPKYADFIKHCSDQPITLRYTFVDKETEGEYEALLNITSEEKAAYSFFTANQSITDEFVEARNYYRMVHGEKATYYANLDALKSLPIADNAVKMIAYSAGYAPVLNFDGEKASYEVGISKIDGDNYQYERIVTAGGRRITAYFDVATGEISYIDTGDKNIRLKEITHTEEESMYAIRGDYTAKNGMDLFLA